MECDELKNYNISWPTFINVTCTDFCMFCAMNFTEDMNVNLIHCSFTTCDKHFEMLTKNAIK